MKTKWSAVYKSSKGFLVKKRANKPVGCSTPRRVCISCQVAVISKLDSCYESKICKACTDVKLLNSV